MSSKNRDGFLNKNTLLGTVFAAALGGASAMADIPADAVWIDVRTSSEYASGHLEGATQIPFDGIEVGVARLQLDKDTPIYLYCGSGRRAGVAKQRLEAQEYTNIVNAGGLEDARRLVSGDQSSPGQ